MAIPAGKLQHRLQFSARTAPVDDGYGNVVSGEFTPQFEARCALTFLKGSETVLASRLEARSPVIIAMRNSTNARRITHEWRATDLRTGVIYHIKENPRPTDDRASLEMLAESGVAA
jgi:head-tail adaptor